MDIKKFLKIYIVWALTFAGLAMLAEKVAASAIIGPPGGGGGASIGGVVTGGTDGSVLFVNPAGVLAQDNPNFLYDAFLEKLFTPNLQVSDLGVGVCKADGSGNISSSLVVDADVSASAAIAYSKMANIAGHSVLGNSTGSSGSAAAITAASNNLVLRRGAGGLEFALLENANIDSAAAIARTKIANGSAHRVVINNASGTLSETAALTNGQLLIGSTGNAPVLGTLTGTANQVNVTNGAGSITLSTPQDIATTSNPEFATLRVGDGTAAAPSLTFASDTDTGIYRPAANELGIATNGADRMRFGANGNAAINGVTLGNSHLALQGSPGLTTTSVNGFRVNTTFPEGATSSISAYTTTFSTASAASPYTTTNLTHYNTTAPSIGTNHTITTQTGFLAASTLTGATNNYGFRGAIAAATGRWNLYMEGTADNYLRGNLGIGTTAVTTAVSPATPPVTLYIHDTSTNAKIRISSSSVGQGTVAQTGAGSTGLELTASGMNTTDKYTPAIRFGSTDAQFTTLSPKFGAAIVGEATESYAADTDAGMAITFFTTPNDAGASGGLTERMKIDHNGNVGIGTTSPNASALLDVSSVAKGFLPPRMTTTQRNDIGSPGTPATGLVIYNTTTNQLNVYNGTSWGAVGGAVFIDNFTGTTITATNDATQVWRYTGGSAQTLATITATAAPNGALIEITGTSNTNTITLNNNDTAGGWILNGSWTGGQYSKLVLRLDTTFNRWVEVSRNGL